MRRDDQLLALALCGALAFVSIAAGVGLLQAPEPALPATQLSATPKGQHVILRWDDRKEYREWEYRQRPASGQYGRWEAVAAGEPNTQVVAGLEGGRIYHFQVRGISGGRRGPPSNPAVAVTESEATPPPPPPPPDCCIDLVDGLHEIRNAVEKLSADIIKTFPASLKSLLDSLKATERELERLSKHIIGSDPPEPLTLIMGDLKLTKIVVDGPGGQGEPSCECEPGQLGELYFSNNSDLLVKEAKEEDGELLQSNPVTLAKVREDLAGEHLCGLVIFEGHASEPGPPSYNLDLSERRSQAVKDYLWKEQPEANCPRAAVVTAKGESHDEAIPQRDDDRDRKVRVLWCPWAGGAEADSDSTSPAAPTRA